MQAKAKWIWQHMPKGTDFDDVYDVIRGNITNPSEFVAQVQSLADEYDSDLERGTNKLRKYYD